MEDTDPDYTERLRTVFDLCDEQNEGYITVDHFKNQVKEHFGDFGGEVGIINDNTPVILHLDVMFDMYGFW